MIRRSLRTGVSDQQTGNLVCKGKGGEGSHDNSAKGSAGGGGATLGVAAVAVAAAARGATVAA